MLQIFQINISDSVHNDPVNQGIMTAWNGDIATLHQNLQIDKMKNFWEIFPLLLIILVKSAGQQYSGDPIYKDQIGGNL